MLLCGLHIYAVASDVCTGIKCVFYAVKWAPKEKLNTLSKDGVFMMSLLL